MEDIIPVPIEATTNNPPILSSIISRLSPLIIDIISLNLFEIDSNNSYNTSSNLKTVTQNTPTIVHSIK